MLYPVLEIFLAFAVIAAVVIRTLRLGSVRAYAKLLSRGLMVIIMLFLKLLVSVVKAMAWLIVASGDDTNKEQGHCPPYGVFYNHRTGKFDDGLDINGWYD